MQAGEEGAIEAPAFAHREAAGVHHGRLSARDEQRHVGAVAADHGDREADPAVGACAETPPDAGRVEDDELAAGLEQTLDRATGGIALAAAGTPDDHDVLLQRADRDRRARVGRFRFVGGPRAARRLPRALGERHALPLFAASMAHGRTATDLSPVEGVEAPMDGIPTEDRCRWFRGATARRSRR
jgi:hypothetical protein